MFSFIADKLNVKNIGEMLAPTLTPEQELHAAIETGMQDKVLHFFNDVQMDPNTPSPTGNLPIHTASYHGRIAVLELLLARGVDVNRTGPRDNTPLHFAAAQGHDDTVRFLIERGANPAMRNRMGKTPYDLAKGDRIRQFLLPLQFRHEDPAQAAAYLPPGITPSVDPLAPKPEIAPPPIGGDYSQFGGPPQQSQQMAQMPQGHSALYAAATHSAIPRGGAAAARITRGEYRPIQADGFGTSVGNEALTAKFGNTREVKVTAPPPGAAAAGGLNAMATAGTPPVDGMNPYAAQPRSAAAAPAGGYAGYAPPPAGGTTGGTSAPPRGPPQFKIFNPKLAATQQQLQPSGGAGAFGAGASPAMHAPAYNNYNSNSNLQTVSLDAASGGGFQQQSNYPNEEEVNLSSNASVLQ